MKLKPKAKKIAPKPPRIIGDTVGVTVEAVPPTPVVFVAPSRIVVTAIEGLKPGAWVYLRNGGLDVPAMVTKVVETPDVINLSTIEDGNATLHCYAAVRYSDVDVPLTWHWMGLET